MYNSIISVRVTRKFYMHTFPVDQIDDTLTQKKIK